MGEVKVKERVKDRGGKGGGRGVGWVSVSAEHEMNGVEGGLDTWPNIIL